MNEIRVTVETDEFKRLVAKKDDLSWHDFIMTLVEK